MRSHLYIVLDAIDQVLASGGRLPRRSDAALRRDCMDGDIGLLMHGSAVGHQDAIEQENTAINARFGIANRFRGLIIAIGLLIVSASLRVALGSEQAPNPTHVIIDRSQ